MTLPASGQIGFSDVNTEVYGTAVYSSDLSFLNSLILPSQRPAPSMAGFYGLTYFQNNNNGNCNNGNCTSNCNCGNIQCNNCVISGTVNCANCDSQKWLQSNCNCACTYNCTTSQTSYNCNCACNCSKIVCAKLYDYGLLGSAIWQADQEYGRWLRKNDKSVYRGYIRWARISVAWMEGKGPDFMVWLPKEKRSEAQRKAATDMAIKIATPWAEHMAYLMGTLKNDNLKGRILMNIGRPICKLVNLLPRSNKPQSQRKHNLLTLYTMWFLFYFSYYTATACEKIILKTEKIKKLQES